MRTHGIWTDSTWIALLFAALLVAAGVAPVVSGAPTGTDGMAAFSFNPSSVEATPGEQFTLKLDLRSTPQFATGIETVGVVVLYNSTYVEATGVEAGPFMNLRDETNIETNLSEINNEKGYVIYELERVPPKDGTYGFATFASLGFEVKEGAPNGTFDVGVYRTRILLTDGMYQRTRKGTATVRIDRSNPDTQTGSDQRTTHSPTTTGSTPTPTPSTGTAAGNDAGGDTGLGLAGTSLVLAGGVGLFGGMLVLMRQYVPATAGGVTAGGNEQFSGTCPECGNSFETREAVRDHAWQAHAICYRCSASFDSWKQLRSHVESHE